MGLQITAHNRLELVENNKLEEKEYFENENARIISLFNNPEFPYHIGGLQDQVLYKVKGQTFSFRSGNTKSFKEWKEWLAKVAGYKNLAEVWKTKKSGPFSELLKFSDSEGCIGPVVARKLYTDFKDYEQIAMTKSIELGYSIEFYNNWSKAFSLASRENGVVIFK